MSSSGMIMMMILLFYVWILCSTTNIFTSNYFNKRVWFNDGNIFHIDEEHFWTTFQQHRNVNRHINWLANEISSINRKIKLVKDQIAYVIHTNEERISILPENDNSIRLSINNKSSLLKTKLINHQNIYILKLLSNESLFNEYLQDLIDIYEISSTRTSTIECIAVIRQQNSNEKYLFIKLSNGDVDRYEMNKTKSLRKTLRRISKSILIWSNDGKQPEYYRRFILDNQKNQIMVTDQLTEIKNRPKQMDANFFDMMGQVLRLKYHIDPSSLSCIFEAFFGHIYTCDGRLVHPHELKLLSDGNNVFVFHAIMMDTLIEKQIYPLDTNYHVRIGDQIFFLFKNHPQFNSLSSLTCTDCPRSEQAFVLNNNEGETQKNTNNRIIEPQPAASTDNIIQNTFLINPQNYIVYVIVTSIAIYILIGIYLTRKRESTGYLGKRHSLSSRRGR